jgi:uncharacterized protein (DUF433 family)
MELTGVGLYSLRDAALLTGAKPFEIKRWLFGYTFRHGHQEVRFSPPLWQTQLAGLGRMVIGFRDLIELRFVHAFVSKGVDLRVVRRCATVAREMFGTHYPFTMERFRTDGRTIYYDAVEAEGKKALLDLRKKQWSFDSVIRPSLYEGLEFNEDGTARRWFPSRSDAIVVDPELVFGKPALREFGIPTATVSAYMHAEGSKSKVARVLNIPLTAVETALRFEQRLAA